MMRFVTALVVLGGALTFAHGAEAASFDCAKAATPFEKAICGSPDLSKADEELAAGYKAAGEGLSAGAVEILRKGQHDWLEFAQRACTHDALPLKKGTYDEDGIACMQSVFSERTDALAASQTFGGKRFYLVSSYDALKDDDANADMPYWVGTNVMTALKIDGDDDTAKGFNAMIDKIVEKNAASTAGEATEDISLNIRVGAVTPVRIGVTLETYDFGHGAAHGNYALNTENYLVAEKRTLVASDVFSGKDWEGTLRTLVVEQATSDMADDLMLDDPASLDEAIIDPTRWDFSDAGLIVQFQPYEIAAYAVGAPTVTVPWDKLADITTHAVEGLKATK